MRFHQSLLLVAMGLFAAHPRVAWAVPPTPETAAMTEKARQLYDEGLAAFKKGKVAEAHAAYLAAWSLNKHWQIAANLADTEIELGKYREAAEHATYYRQNAPANRKERAEALLKRALDRVAVLTIAAEPDGAEVLVDDLAIGKAPLPQAVFVDPGKHKVTVRLSGRPDAVQELTLGAGASQAVTLKVPPAAPDAGTPPVTAPKRSVVPGVVLGAGAGVALVTGIALFAVARGKGSSAHDAHDAIVKAGHTCVSGAPNFDARCADLDSATATANTLQQAGVGLFVGAGAAALGTVLYFAWPAPRAGAAGTGTLRLAPVVSPSTAGLSFSGTF
jgi:hypothetical protein